MNEKYVILGILSVVLAACVCFLVGQSRWWRLTGAERRQVNREAKEIAAQWIAEGRFDLCGTTILLSIARDEAERRLFARKHGKENAK